MHCAAADKIQISSTEHQNTSQEPIVDGTLTETLFVASVFIGENTNFFSAINILQGTFLAVLFHLYLLRHSLKMTIKKRDKGAIQSYINKGLSHHKIRMQCDSLNWYTLFQKKGRTIE